MRWAPAAGLVLAACATPPGPDEARLTYRDGTVSGQVGFALTNEEVRRRLVEPECRARGLGVGSVTFGRIADGARDVRATCAAP